LVNNDQYYQELKNHLSKNSSKIEKNTQTQGFIINEVQIGQNFVVMQLPKGIYTFRFGNYGTQSNFIYSFKKLKIPLITEYTDIELRNIILSSHPDRVLFNYSFKEKNNIVVWDFEENKEVSSFSSRETDEFISFIYGPIEQVTEAIEYKESFKETKKKGIKKKEKVEEVKDRKEKYKIENGDGEEQNKKEEPNEDEKSEDDELNEDGEKYMISSTGYIIFDNYYVNLDTMLPYPYLKFDNSYFNEDFFGHGPKMNFEESLALFNGSIYSSYSYQDIDFREKRDFYIGQFMISKFYIGRAEVCKYFVERKSILLDYILEDEKLPKILEFLEEDPLYLSLILTPNYKNKTPLDEAIENNSPKVVEMLLKSVLKLKEFKLSNTFKHQFIDLFDMGVEAFRLYLSLCYFTTGQMEYMKKMLVSGGEGTLRVSTTSSILNNKFNKNFLSDKKKKENIIQKVNNEEEKALEESEDNSNQDSETLISDTTIDEIEHDDDINFFNPDRKEIRVEVKAVEFDWVLTTKEGTQFLDDLRKTDNLSYFEIDVIKDIILFQWGYFLPRILMGIFAPFLIFFGLFILYTTWILDEKFNEADSSGDWHTTALVMGI